MLRKAYETFSINFHLFIIFIILLFSTHSVAFFNSKLPIVLVVRDRIALLFFFFLAFKMYDL